MVQESIDQITAEDVGLLVVKADNEAQILLYSTEQTIKDFADKFSESDLAEIQLAMEELREAKDRPDRDVESLKVATGHLQAIMHKFAELMYSAPDSSDSLT